jgi:diguanylate cyclase (GGDEF)-like protein
VEGPSSPGGRPRSGPPQPAAASAGVADDADSATHPAIQAALALASALAVQPGRGVAARVAEVVGHAWHADRSVVLAWDADRQFLRVDAVFDLDQPPSAVGTGHPPTGAQTGVDSGPTSGWDRSGLRDAWEPVALSAARAWLPGLSLPPSAVAWLSRQPVARTVAADDAGVLGLLAQVACVDRGFVVPAAVDGRLQALVVAGWRGDGPVEATRLPGRVLAGGGIGPLAGVAGLGLRVEALKAELRHSSETDAVTGLPSLRTVARSAVAQLAEGRRRATPVGVLVVDLDDFHAVNARVGLAGGDRALALVAERLRAAVRGADTVGRLAGDAFVVVLAQAGQLPELAAVAARVVQRLTGSLAVDGAALGISASVGLSQARPDELAIDGALARADLALRRAQQAGGHRLGLPDGAVVDPLDVPGGMRPRH